MARKTENEIELMVLQGGYYKKTTAIIIGQSPENKPYVNIEVIDKDDNRLLLGIKDKDLERFAVNILKALGSKKLAENSPAIRYVNPNDIQ